MDEAVNHAAPEKALDEISQVETIIQRPNRWRRPRARKLRRAL